MSCTEKYFVEVLMKVVNELKAISGGRWQDIDPSRAVSSYTESGHAHFAIQALTQYRLAKSECSSNDWPSNWPALTISELAKKLHNGEA